MPGRLAHYLAIPLAVVLAASLGPGGRAAAAQAAAYEVEDIGRPEGATGGVRGDALNDDGAIAGAAATLDGERPFLYRRGEFVYLDEPAGRVFVGGVNGEGTVVGAVADDPTGEGMVAVVWEDGAATVLPALGGEGGEARAINEAATVVDVASTAAGPPHAARWRDGEATDLAGRDGDFSEANDVNDDEVVVGSVNRGGFTQAVLWRDGEMVELGTLGGDSSLAFAINAGGQVVGQSSTEPGKAAARAFLWQDGEMSDLGAPDGFPFAVASDINGNGQVVGHGYDESGNFTAVLWDDGEASDLNDLIPAGSGVTLSLAVAINEAGQILCLDGAGGTFLLTPAQDAGTSGGVSAGRHAAAILPQGRSRARKARVATARPGALRRR